MILVILGGVTFINSSKFHILKGDNFLSFENYEKAISSYEKALEIDKENEVAYLGIYESYLNLGNNEMAKKYIEQGLIFLPKSALLMEKWEQLNEDVIVIEEEAMEASETTTSNQDLELVKQDIQEMLDNQLLRHIQQVPPAFNILENQLPEMEYLLTVALSDDYSGEEWGTIEYINEKISQRFNINLNLSVDDVKDYNTWQYYYWNEEQQRFVLPERGYGVITLSEILNIEEKDGFYEAEVMHFGEVSSWDYPTAVLFQGENRRIVGNSYYGEQQLFYPIDELETSTYRFQYNENDDLVVVSCELAEPHQVTNNFTQEMAIEFIYQYFNLDLQADVMITMLGESPFEYEGTQYYKFDFVNTNKLSFEWGARTGQYWVSEYGGIYELDEEGNPFWLVIG